MHIKNKLTDGLLRLTDIAHSITHINLHLNLSAR